jgi:hypothetical protein
MYATGCETAQQKLRQPRYYLSKSLRIQICFGLMTVVTEDKIEPGAFKLRGACKYIGGVSEITMRRLVASGQIKPNRKLRHLLFPKSELDRFLNGDAK